jgi:hypothetical protein
MRSCGLASGAHGQGHHKRAQLREITENEGKFKGSLLELLNQLIKHWLKKVISTVKKSRKETIETPGKRSENFRPYLATCVSK